MLMQFKIFLIIFITLIASPIMLHAKQLNRPQAKHFDKIMVILFENMSYPEIKNEPTFKKLLTYTGYHLDDKGNLQIAKNGNLRDSLNNGYAFFSRYYNNHNGGILPARPSQPNYIAMTSGSTQGIINNEIHDLKVDNLAKELIDAGISWKVYAEDLPDPTSAALHSQSPSYNTSGCFTAATYPSDDGYKRKHEPFISYVNIQEDNQYCKNIVNSIHLNEDLNKGMPDVSFYIPNQVNDGHNGSLSRRMARANAFLSKMMGTDAKTGEPLPDAERAPLQQFMSQGGLVVITFDEPSTTGNLDLSMYMLLAGKMINSGAYPNHSGEKVPICYPAISEQIRYQNDMYGTYARSRCNHYNLLKMIEANYGLRGLYSKHTSAGYKYAYALDNNVSELWKRG